MRYYFTTRDNGDGSSSVEFFDSAETIEFAEEQWPEDYGAGEGGGYLDVDGTITGWQYGKMEVTTMADLQRRISEDEEYADQ